jgi:hypothetical protein
MDESWCSGCAEDAYVCAHTGNRYARQRNVVLMANGDYWNVDYFEDFGFTCEGTDENYHIDDSVNLENGTTWCESYFADNGFVCSHCEGRFHNYEMSDQQEMSCVSCEDSEGHIAQAGRDESPTQLEIPLPWEYRLGDVVTMKHTASYCAGMTGIVVTIEQSVNSAMPIQICCNTMQTMWVFACDILSISRPQS